MLYADFASILKQEDDKQQDTMNQIKTQRKGQTASTHMPSGWCVHSALAYIDVLHSMKTYHGKECVEMFVEHIENKVKECYVSFQKQPMTEIPDEHEKEHQKGT